MLSPGPWRRGTDIDITEDSYVTRSRCKTGYKIKRCCSRCGNWEVWRWNVPLSGRFSSWSDARDALIAETYGQHDRLALGMDALRTAVRRTNRHAHRPHPDRWDAEWLLFSSRWVITTGSWEIPDYDRYFHRALV